MWTRPSRGNELLDQVVNPPGFLADSISQECIEEQGSTSKYLLDINDIKVKKEAGSKRRCDWAMEIVLNTEIEG